MAQPSLTHRLSAEIRAEIARQRKVVSTGSVATGIPESTLRRKVKGERALTLDELAAICGWLDVSIPDLLDRCAPLPHHGDVA